MYPTLTDEASAEEAIENASISISYSENFAYSAILVKGKFKILSKKFRHTQVQRCKYNHS